VHIIEDCLLKKVDKQLLNPPTHPLMDVRLFGIAIPLVIKCKSRADRSKPVGLLVRPPAACSAHGGAPIWTGLTVKTGKMVQITGISVRPEILAQDPSEP